MEKPSPFGAVKGYVRKLQETRGKQNVDLYEADDVLEVYADGASSIIFTQSICKVDFFRTQPSKSTNDEAQRLGTAAAPEQRVVRLRVAIPTAQLVETCAKVLDLINSNRDAMDPAFKQQTDQVFEIAARFATVTKK